MLVQQEMGVERATLPSDAADDEYIYGAGDATQMDMIESVNRGIFAVNFGVVRLILLPAVCVCSERAYLIEQGK